MLNKLKKEQSLYFRKMSKYVKHLIHINYWISNFNLLPHLAASFIAKCKTDDTKCLQESTQAAIATFASGLPDNKVEELDPLMFDQVNASSASLDFTLSNVSITGMKGCLAKKVQ